MWPEKFQASFQFRKRPDLSKIAFFYPLCRLGNATICLFPIEFYHYVFLFQNILYLFMEEEQDMSEILDQE